METSEIVLTVGVTTLVAVFCNVVVEHSMENPWKHLLGTPQFVSLTNALWVPIVMAPVAIIALTDIVVTGKEKIFYQELYLCIMAGYVAKGTSTPYPTLSFSSARLHSSTTIYPQH